MFFTQEDYKKIEQWLLANSRKDTDFISAVSPLDGNETIVLVQNNKNVNASVRDFVNQLFLLGVSDFLNITDKYNESYISLAQATELIPSGSRKTGQVITFLDEGGHWRMYQFQGQSINQWNTSSLWVDLIALLTGSVVIDSDDIIPEVNEANQIKLKFADKIYNISNYSGLGRAYLKKNIVEVEDSITHNTITVNLLQQSMISRENTIYVIQYDYNLNGQSIVIPEGSVLIFEGGSIEGGTIQLIDTKIILIGGDISAHVTATITGTYAEGQVLYDKILKKCKLWNGTVWVNLDGTNL